MNYLVCIVEDEPDISELLAVTLKKANFLTRCYLNGNDFLSNLEKDNPSLIVLDLMLPDIDGLEICRLIRNTIKGKNIPIIMLTAKSDEIDKVLGLELGADDYITKPFSPRELVARIKAVLRRKDYSETEKFIDIDGIIKIDPGKFEVFVNDEKIELTSTEFKLLKLMVQRRGWVFSREQMLDYLWGNDKIVLDRTIDVHVKNLRDKLGIARDYIKNIRGVGYKFD